MWAAAVWQCGHRKARVAVSCCQLCQLHSALTSVLLHCTAALYCCTTAAPELTVSHRALHSTVAATSTLHSARASFTAAVTCA